MTIKVGQLVKILSCESREELVGKMTTITEEESTHFDILDYADVYGIPAYRVSIDHNFRPVEEQLEIVDQE